MPRSHEDSEVHVVNKQMTQTIEQGSGATLFIMHRYFMLYLAMFPKFLAQIRKLHISKVEISEVYIHWEKAFQFASEIHLETNVRRQFK